MAFAASKLFGVSFALGAFVAGMVLSESQLSQRAAEETLPLRDAFAALFFISVGMLFDPTILVRDPLPLLGTLFVVMIGTPTLAFILLRVLKQPFSTALTIAMGLAQIGEFSFILVGLGIELDVVNERARDLVLGASILSIFLNPGLFFLRKRVQSRLDRRRTASSSAMNQVATPAKMVLPTTKLRDHAILVGHGRVGSLVATGLREAGWTFLVIEAGDAAIAPLQEHGIEVIVGNAADPALLTSANVAHARLLLVAIPDAFEAGQIVHQARTANPAIDIIARAHFDEEVTHLTGLGAGTVVMGEREIARAMLDHTVGETARLVDG
jgi:monovalent cation:H+ antiporter-2, CPA2 family